MSDYTSGLGLLGKIAEFLRFQVRLVADSSVTEPITICNLLDQF